MGIEIDSFNTLYVGGNKGRRFEIRFTPDPRGTLAPWCVYSRCTGHYFQTLREALAFVAGRGWIEVAMIGEYQKRIMDTLAQKWEEE